MPFIKFDNTSFEQSHTSDPDNLPIFLIPGILGNSNELYKLAEEINAQKKGRTPIYIYQEPSATDELMKMSLAEHSEKIAKEILEIRQFSPLPYILVGYSFGGTLASEVASHLQLQAVKYDANLKIDPRVYVIDEPALSCVKKYMAPENNINFYHDLAKIVNYAAYLSEISQINLTEEFFYEHKSDEFEDYIYHFEAEVLANPENANLNADNINNFITLLEIAKRNLRNMAYSDSQNINMHENVHVIFTNETALKYSNVGQTAKNFLGEWDKCSKQVIHLNPTITSKLSTQSHLDLLKGDNEALKQNNAALVAGLITHNLKQEISSKSLMQKHLQTIYNQLYSAANKKQPTPMQFFNLFNNPEQPIDAKAARSSSLTIQLDQSSEKFPRKWN